MPEPGTAIQIDALRVSRGGRRVLHDVSLSFPEHRVVGLLGPSGCGKTTLMRCIVGTQIVESGSVRVLGLDAGSPPLRRRVGYMTQVPSVYGDLTVVENLRFFGRVVGVSQARVDEVVALVDLGLHAHQVVSTLSGGERARVSLGTALLADPDVLVLDEPTVGLDPVLRRSLWEIFHALADRGRTVIVSSHVMDEAEHCDGLLLMRDGRVLATGAPAELVARTGAADVEGAFLALVEDDAP